MQDLGVVRQTVGGELVEQDGQGNLSEQGFAFLYRIGRCRIVCPCAFSF